MAFSFCVFMYYLPYFPITFLWVLLLVSLFGSRIFYHGVGPGQEKDRRVREG